MPIVVQKYGGSSVADVEKIRKVARKVKARREEGFQLVVVVSAMGDTTDELLSLAKKVSNDPPRRELDMLLTCGERISMALLAMALFEEKVPSISFTGSQSGIITDDSHSQARIVEVRPFRIEEALREGKVVIVAGYQGVSYKKEVTTLGRGGSDTTAVALAAALKADCEIYSDVDGVFSADPRKVPDARKLDVLSYEEMQELAFAGARVLNAQAVEFAKEKGIVIHARSTHEAGTGTAVYEVPRGVQRVKGVALEDDMVFLSARPEVLSSLLGLLAEKGIKPRSLHFEGLGAEGSVFVAVPLQDVHGLDAFRKELEQRLGEGARVHAQLGSVTCVGAGIGADLTYLQRVFGLAEKMGVRLWAAHTSWLQLSVVVEKTHLAQLCRTLHAEFIGAA
jgi:aspartate kinase